MRETIIEQFYFVRRRSAIPLERLSIDGSPILSGPQRQRFIFIFF